jgi:hypothetical protein
LVLRTNLYPFLHGVLWHYATLVFFLFSLFCVCKKNKKKKTAKFLVSEQEVAMPTTRETHHSGKFCRFFSFSFFYTSKL